MNTDTLEQAKANESLITDLREASATLRAGIHGGIMDKDFLALAKRLKAHADRLSQEAGGGT